MKFSRHLFVCTQQRAGGGKPACGNRGGPALVAAIERALATDPAVATVAVTGCACLGPCFDGPNAVMYPEGTWYAGLTVDDAAALVAHLTTGEVAEARRYAWDDDAI